MRFSVGRVLVLNKAPGGRGGGGPTSAECVFSTWAECWFCTPPLALNFCSLAYALSMASMYRSTLSALSAVADHSNIQGRTHIH